MQDLRTSTNQHLGYNEILSSFQGRIVCDLNKFAVKITGVGKIRLGPQAKGKEPGLFVKLFFPLS